MKQWITAILALALLACGATTYALGDEAAAGSAIQAAVEDGSYVIRISDPNGDLGWVADDMAQDDSVVTLAGAALVDDAFVVKYDPAGDGDVTVGIRHYTGIACDEMHTFDLRVKDGAVQESIGGSYAASPDAADQDPYLSGEWLEDETEFAHMTIAMNEAGRGWDVEIASAAEENEFVFMTTVYFDCDLNGFVYDKGKFWDAAAAGPGLGEAAVAGTTGIFTFTGEGEDLRLSWYDDQHPERGLHFRRL